MCTCSFWAYIAYFDSGCRCSQQHSAPMRPSGVSWTTERSLPSPSPKTVRSTCVGLSLRRCAIVSPSGADDPLRDVEAAAAPLADSPIDDGDPVLAGGRRERSACGVP